MATETLGIASIDPVIDSNINEDLGIGLRYPQQSYQPHVYPYQPQGHRHPQTQPLEASTTPDFAMTIQYTNVRSESADVGRDRRRSIDISEGSQGLCLAEGV